MNHRSFLSRQLIPCLFLCVGIGHPVIAEGSDHSQRFRAGVDLHSFHYKEYDSQGKLLDREDGLVPGVAIGFEAGSGVHTIALRAGAWDGSVDYDGQTQSGAALSTTTDTTLTHYSVTFLRDIATSGHSATLFAELGARHWDRNIRETARTSGLLEVYHWPYYLLGGSITLSKGDRVRVGATASVGRSFSSTLEVHISGYDTATLDLEAGTTYRLSMPVSYRSSPERTLIVEPYFHYWHFDESQSQPLQRNGVTVGRIREPENETSSFGIALSMAF